jgi:hypothetical protein
VAPAVPPVPGIEFQLENYRSQIRALAIVWFAYAGLALVVTFFGLAFAKAFFSGAFGGWMHGPMPPAWIIPPLIHFTWLVLIFRTALAAAAGWGLMEHTQWGRIVAIVAAIINLIHFPFGTALGIWTLIMLIGYQNCTIYERSGA